MDDLPIPNSLCSLPGLAPSSCADNGASWEEGAQTYEDIALFECLLRSHRFGPASDMRSHWPPISFQEAISSIHAACKYCSKDFSKDAVLAMAEDYIQYNYLSKSSCLEPRDSPASVVEFVALPGKCFAGGLPSVGAFGMKVA